MRSCLYHLLKPEQINLSNEKLWSSVYTLFILTIPSSVIYFLNFLLNSNLVSCNAILSIELLKSNQLQKIYKWTKERKKLQKVTSGTLCLLLSIRKDKQFNMFPCILPQTNWRISNILANSLEEQ